MDSMVIPRVCLALSASRTISRRLFFIVQHFVSAVLTFGIRSSGRCGVLSADDGGPDALAVL